MAKLNVQIVPLSSVLFDDTWNSRQGGWKNEKPATDGKPAEGPQGSTGFQGLIQSISLVGQDNPIDVRKNPTKSKHEWMAVTGFRRGAALEHLAKAGVNAPGFDAKSPAIKINVRELTEPEAVALNLRENTEREGLSTADVAHTVAKLIEAHGYTDTAVAGIIGKSQGHVSQLHRIVKGTKASILKNWRENPIDPLSLAVREKLATEPKEAQDELYTSLLSASEGKKKRSGGGAGKWMKNAVKQAAGIGELLGSLQRDGLLKMAVAITAENVKQFQAGGLMSIKRSGGATDQQWETLAIAAANGFKGGLMPPAPKEEKKAPATTAPNAN